MTIATATIMATDMTITNSVVGATAVSAEDRLR